MEAGIINDLAIVTVTAAVVTIVFRALNISVLLGYLIAGLIVGPHTSTPWVKNIHTINELSELGVAFLMFYIGLEFDLNKLQRIMGPAFLAVLFQTILMLFVGMLTAPLLGWTGVNGLFLGCLLAISSTMITLPILKAQDAMKANFAQVAIGILILEDILAIMVLVVLTGVGVTGHFQWEQAWQVVFFVGVFVVMVYFIGKLLAPKLANLLKKFGSPEMITVVSVAMLLGIGELAETFNFSIALGAFLAGSILSQGSLSQEIEHAIEPLRSLFTAIFFVTVGMKIEPALLAKYWLSIVILTLVVVIGKTLMVFIGLFLTGAKPKTAFKAAVCKAQIGEFSFVIAGLGLTYHITDPGMMTIAVGVALGTIIIIPIFSEHAERTFFFLLDKMPQSFLQSGKLYTNLLDAIKLTLKKNAFLSLVKRPLLQILTYFLLFNGILISVAYLSNMSWVQEYSTWVQYGFWIIGAMLCLPFLIAIIRNMEVVVLLITETTFTNRANKIFKRGKIRNIINTAILCLVLTILGGIYLSAAASFLPSGVALLAFVTLVILLSFFFWKHIVRVNSRLEQMFHQSFNGAIQSNAESRRDIALKAFSKKHPWHVDLYDVELQADSEVCGKRIFEINLREKTGVSIIGISRDVFTIYDPGPEVPLFPGDHLILIGSKNEIALAKEILNQKIQQEEKALPAEKFEIDKVYLSASSSLVGCTIADSAIRRQYKLTIVGIQRGEKRITSPSPDEILKTDDILIVVGTKRTIESFKSTVEAHHTSAPESI